MFEGVRVEETVCVEPAVLVPVREDEIVTVLVDDPFALPETVLVRVEVREELTVPELEPVEVGVRE